MDSITFKITDEYTVAVRRDVAGRITITHSNLTEGSQKAAFLDLRGVPNSNYRLGGSLMTNGKARQLNVDEARQIHDAIRRLGQAC